MPFRYLCDRFAQYGLFISMPVRHRLIWLRLRTADLGSRIDMSLLPSPFSLSIPPVYASHLHPLCHTHISLFIVPGPLSAPGQAFLWARSRAGRQGTDPECLSVSAGVRACVVQECQGANYCETLPMSCTDRNDAFVFMVYPEIVKVMDVALSLFLLSVLMFILKT